MRTAMMNDFYIVKKIYCEPTTQSLETVSFDLNVLDKYKNPNYDINLNNEVGTLSSKTDGWSISIDVHKEYINCFFYKLGALPDSEQKHFVKYNIYA